MGLLFIDGFDHYPQSSMIGKNYSLYDFGQVVFSTNCKRFFSGQGVAVQGYQGGFKKNIGVYNLSTIYFGIAIYKQEDGTISASTTYPLISFLDSVSTDQVKLCANLNYGISVYRGDNTLLGSTANNLFSDKKWFYLEAKVTISATVGVVEIRINEQQVLNLTSKNTKNGSDYIEKILFKVIYDRDTYYDDLYIDDSQFHGDCQVKTFMPDSDGNSADFTRSTGSNDYECVDEAVSNIDTDYIFSNTLNHKSIFGITTGALEIVKGIQVNNHCRLEEAGVRKITPIVRSGGTDYSGTEKDAIAANYYFESEVWELDPDDSGAWDQTKLEAAEFGLEITT